MNQRAVVLLSGGQDSATCLYWAKARFAHVEAVCIDYGQRHRVEIDCARRLSVLAGAPFTLLPLEALSVMGGNALTDSAMQVNGNGGMNNLPSTFVPGRNALFLTLAAAFAVPRGISQIVTGVCQTDYSGYPDCRENFVASLEQSLSLAMDSGLTLHRPLMWLGKGEIFALARELGALDAVLENSHTCYEGVRTQRHAWGYGCGECPACGLRRAGYQDFQSSLQGAR